MPYAVSPSPTSSLTVQPNKNTARKPVLRFGLGSFPDPGINRLEAYQDAVLKSFPELKQKYGTQIDMKGGYRLLSFEMKRLIDQTIKRVSPQAIIRYRKQNQLGLVEEGSDAMFELLQLRVVQKDWITEAQIERWGDLLRNARAARRSFADFIRQIEGDLPEHTIEAFQQMSQLPYDQAKGLLALMGGKYAIFSVEQGKRFNLKTDTHPLLMGEIKELTEHNALPGRDRIALSALGLLYTHIPVLPVSLFERLMVGYMHLRLNLPVHFEDMTQLTHYKMLNRQYMHYHWNGGEQNFKKAYDDRKAYYKGFEVLAEAGVLNRAEREAGKAKLETVG